MDRIDRPPGRFMHFPPTSSCPVVFLSQPLYLQPNTLNVVYPIRLVKPQDREGRHSFKMDAGRKKDFAYYSSQPDFGNRSATPHRSTSDIRKPDQGEGIKPILIRHNRPAMKRVEFLEPGKNQSGTDEVFVSFDQMLTYEGVEDQHHRAPIRRTASAAPELERVREWLHRSDFSQGLNGVSSNGNKKQDLADMKNGVSSNGNKKQDLAEMKNGVSSNGTKKQNLAEMKRYPEMQVDTSAVALQTDSSYPSPTSPLSIPPPPPPPPPLIPVTPKLHKTDVKTKLMKDLSSNSLTPKRTSPIATSSPKLLFSSEMAASRRTKKQLENIHVDAESLKSPTTPSEKHFENFLDSIFAKALGSESDGQETLRSRHQFVAGDSCDARSEISGSSAYPYLGKDHGIDALFAELKDKLKIKGLTTESSEEFNNHIPLAANDDNRTHGDMHSEVSSVQFVPLAASTPPLRFFTSPQPQLQPEYALQLASLSKTPKSVILEVSPSPPTAHKRVIYSGTLPCDHLHDYGFRNRDPPKTPSSLSSMDDSNREYNLETNRDNLKSGLHFHQSILTQISVNQTDIASRITAANKIQDQGLGDNVDLTRNSLVAASFSQREEGHTDDSADRRVARTNCETNTQECFIDSTNGVQFKPGQNGTKRVSFDTSRKSPEQRNEALHQDLHIDNTALYNNNEDNPLRLRERRNILSIGTRPTRGDQDYTRAARDDVFFEAKTNYFNTIEYHSSTNLTGRHELHDSDTGIRNRYSLLNKQAFVSDHNNPGIKSGDVGYSPEYLTQKVDHTVPDAVLSDIQSVYGYTVFNHTPSSCHEEAVLPTRPALFPPPRNTQQRAGSLQQLGSDTHLQGYDVTTGDSPETVECEDFLPKGTQWFDPHCRFIYEEDITEFRGQGDSNTKFGYNDISNVNVDTRLSHDSDAVLENVNSHLFYSKDDVYYFGPFVHYSSLGGNVDIIQENSANNSVDIISGTRVNNTVSQSPFFISNTVKSEVHIPSDEVNENVSAVGFDNVKDIKDYDISGWYSSSSTDSDTNLQRFTSGAINEKTFNALFTHGAKVSLRARADRTLTGCHHNLISAWPPRYTDDIDNAKENRSQSGQSHSAPNSSRKKKKRIRSLSIKKILSKSSFDLDKSPLDSEPGFVRRVSSNSCDNITDKNGPASPTRINITSSNNGAKVVRIYQDSNTESHEPPSEGNIVNTSTMLSSHNHDHEMLPPSASNTNKKQTSSLLRSKSLFSSTPSLFTRSSPEEKFWKKEKKRLEEERKKLEKQEKKEEKKKIKAKNRAATLNVRSIPKGWDYRPRPIEEVYMRPGLRLAAVPIEYTDVPRASVQHEPPPPSGHYAIPHVILRGQYGHPMSPADMTRVEQIYGTTQRRPHGVQAQSHYASPYGYLPPREQQARVVLLHRSSEGYGFVLRGAKSKLPTGGGFNDFTPTSEYPALQYLDSVDPGSQADRAGLRAGDFILEINGQNVVRSSHEHVVHLIRSSSDVLTLKVVTVTLSDPAPGDWQTYNHDMGAMTLPTRKKIAAPLPPQRDPQTSLSYSKASFKSMREGLAEIEKLDAAIAEFEGQEAARSRSLHALHAGDDQKVASVRAAHALKRVSVMDYEGLITGEPGAVATNGSKTSKGHVSPAEARIKKYHKQSSSQTMERSKSTPDISAAVEEEYNKHSPSGGSWTKSQAPPPPPKSVQYGSPLSGASVYGSGSYGKNSRSGTPDMAHRTPSNHQPSPEVVRIHTANKNVFGTSSPEVNNRKVMESRHESSFRVDARASDNIKVRTMNPEHSVISNANNFSDQNGDKYISFADERVMENAHKFIQKYPNATLLVTADVHSDKTDGNNKDRLLYEPEPDYDDSDNDKFAFSKTNRLKNSMSVGNTNTKLSRGTEDPRNVVNDSGFVIQNKSSVTVISVTSDPSKEGNRHVSSSHSSPHLTNSAKSSPLSIRMHENTTLNSPAQSISSSRRSSGVVMTTPSQPSSAESSRRSSIQSNYSGDNGDKNGRSHTPSSISTITLGNTRNVLEAEVPPPPPPPPPLAMVSKPSSADVSANSTLRRRPNDTDNSAALQTRVSTDDILAAVAERQSRLENEGPRLADVKTLHTSRSTLELNQEALKAAVAKRKSRLDQGEDKSIVYEIEARLNRNKKLQATKYFGSDVNRNGANVKKENEVSPSTESSASTSTTPKSENQAAVSSVKSNDITAPSVPTNKPGIQTKLSPAVPVKSNQSIDATSSEKLNAKVGSSDSAKDSGVNFRSVLKPVDVKGIGSPVVVQSKTPTPSSAAVTTTPGTNITTIVASRPNSGKVLAPPAPPPPPPSTAAAVLTTTQVSTAKPKTELSTLMTSKTGQNPVETKSAVTNPISPTVSTTPSSSDYIALAERARQEYLKKKASGALQANIEKKGPVEITPSKKNSHRSKPTTPTSPSVPLTSSTKPSSSDPIEAKSNQGVKGDNVQISVQDRLKVLQPGRILTNGKTSVAGVTEDHSHTEVSLSNGTIKKPSPNSNVLPPLNIITTSSLGKGSKVTSPPPAFGNSSGGTSTKARGAVIDIIPPPSSFSGAVSPDSAISVPSFGQNDARSFASSASSFSNLSSEHGDDIHHGKPRENINILIAHSPPPPPDFSDSILGDQDAFIPPPPEFLEIDSNGNESKTMDKNSKPFASKPVADWSCMDVLDWLDNLNLPQYRISFAKAHVDGSKLANMGRNEFINLGVAQVAHRMSLERSVKKLNMAASTDL